MNTHSLNRIGIALLIASVAGSTLAAEPNTNDADLLRGPKVADSSSAQGNATMGDSTKAHKRAGELPFRAFVNAVHRLQRAAKDNPELALTDEQRDQIEAITKAHQEKMQAFIEEHRDELMELNRYKPQRGQEGAKGSRRGTQSGEQNDKRSEEQRGAQQPPSASDGFEEGTVEAELAKRPPLSKKEMKQNREKLAKLMERAPSDAEARKQIWAVLNPDQQATVKESIEKVRAKRKQQISMATGRGAKKANPDAQEGERKKKQQHGKRIKEEAED